MMFDFAEVSKEVDAISNASLSECADEQLSALNEKRGMLDFYHREALLTLEKKFHDLCSPLYAQRAKVIASKDESTKNFWLKAMKNHPLISNLITEADEELLGYLIDIKLSYLEDAPGFRLDFLFEANEFISNKVVSKTYFLENVKEAQFQNLLFDKTETTAIQWNQGKNLCKKEVAKTQRHKASGVMRTVTKSVDTESFFHFFDSMTSPDDGDDLDDEQLASIEEEIQIDLELGNVFKLSIIPRAFDWFTGKALSYENFDSDNAEYDELGCDGSGIDDEEEPSFDEEEDVRQDNNRDNPQCKQQ